MNIFTTFNHKKPNYNGGYVNIHDDAFACERTLVITDDLGNTIRLKNEQIGELFDHIKPSLMG